MAGAKKYLLLSKDGEWWTDPKDHGSSLEEAITALSFEPGDRLYVVEILSAPVLREVWAELSLGDLSDG